MKNTRPTESEPAYAGFYKVIAPLIMSSGVGDGQTTACVMAQAATIDALRRGETLDKPTDEMQCACPVLRRMAIRLNDGKWWKDDLERTTILRPLIPLLLDSGGSDALTQRRAFYLADQVVRILTPMRLAWISEKTKNEKLKQSNAAGIKALKALPTIESRETALGASKACEKLRAAAFAAAYAYAAAAAAADADAAADAAAYAAADAYAAAAAAADAERVKYRDSLLATFHACAAMRD